MRIRPIDNYMIDFEKVAYAVHEESEGKVTVTLYFVGGLEIRLEGNTAEHAWTTFRDIAGR